MAYEFFLGIDVADEQADEPGTVSLALIEKSQENADEASTYRLDSMEAYAGDADPEDIADHVQGLLASSPYTARTGLFVNRESKRGQAVYDALEERGLPVRAVTLTDDRHAAPPTLEGDDESVARRETVRAIATAHRQGRVEIQHRETEAASILARRLQHFGALAVDGEAPEAMEGSEAEEGETLPTRFDAVTSSAALAVWFASQRSFDPTSHLKADPQTSGEVFTEESGPQV